MIVRIARPLTLLCVGLFFLGGGCRKNPASGNPEVDAFVRSLLRGEPVAVESGRALPDFSWEDVEALLYYAADTTPVRALLYDPRSRETYGDQPSRLGEAVLWLVEGVRRQGAYPSPLPLLCHRDDSHRLTARELAACAECYRNWWTAVKFLPTGRDVLGGNPLRRAPYRWAPGGVDE